MKEGKETRLHVLAVIADDSGLVELHGMTIHCKANHKHVNCRSTLQEEH